MLPQYARDISTLRSKASMWWNESLKDGNSTLSIIPKLLETQDDFINILQLSKSAPTQVFELVKAANFPANLFLKHLSILSDYGGESIQRLGNSFNDIFPKTNQANNPVIDYIWKGKKYEYVFESMPVKGLSNSKLHIDAKGLQKKDAFDGLKRDMTMILLYASTSESFNQAGLETCVIGSLLGDSNALEIYIKQRYIVVSRITSGANSNSLGQLAQRYIVDFLKNKFGQKYTITSNGKIFLTGCEKSRGMPFDIVVTNGLQSIGIEVSFQVTTNSTIERKAGQAAMRKSILNAEGHKIAYVIDGAGNFQRSSAISNICQHSDCTVAYSDSEFQILANFIGESLK